jgi:hypothetical protein
MAEGATYDETVEGIFSAHYTKGLRTFEFSRDELTHVSRERGVTLPKNLGDLIYTYRFRKPLPKRVSNTAPKDEEWTIELAGQGRYRFRLCPVNRISPQMGLMAIKIPDATPEIISKYALGDEQALLAKVRYNRLLDIFLGIAAFSLQNHLRTTARGIGQIEVDELYVGVNRRGVQYVIPVQAKTAKDHIGAVQTKQDYECCRRKFPNLVCRPVAAQFLEDGRIAMFELSLGGDRIVVVKERHYILVPADNISNEELLQYRSVNGSSP